MPSPLVPFVGRVAEVGAVAAVLDAAARGVAGVVALAGEPGAGKSRLAEEGSALARARGFLTLRATASPVHADLPYGVVVDALRPVVRTVEAGARTRLVEGLPDLGRLFDGLNLPAPPPLGNPSMERTRLFEAVCRLFDRLARQQPVLLFVDDIHWADPTSLALLHYVVRGLTDRRFLVLVTCRTGESGPELDALWASLGRSGVLTQVTVGHLDAQGITALARGLLADDPPATLTGVLAERTPRRGWSRCCSGSSPACAAGSTRAWPRCGPMCAASSSNGGTNGGSPISPSASPSCAAHIWDG